jgi:hypothetical protein
MSHGLGVPFLVAGVLLVTAGAVALAVVPATECPALASVIERTIAGVSNPQQIEKLRKCRIRGHRSKPCAVCGTSCKVPLLKRWLQNAP